MAAAKETPQIPYAPLEEDAIGDVTLLLTFLCLVHISHDLNAHECVGHFSPGPRLESLVCQSA